MSVYHTKEAVFEHTLSSWRSYGRLATMTLFLDGIPSAGGPRSRRSRGGRVVCGLASLDSVVAWLVVSVKGRTSVVAGASVAPSSVRDCSHISKLSSGEM